MDTSTFVLLFKNNWWRNDNIYINDRPFDFGHYLSGNLKLSKVNIKGYGSTAHLKPLTSPPHLVPQAFSVTVSHFYNLWPPLFPQILSCNSSWTILNPLGSLYLTGNELHTNTAPLFSAQQALSYKQTLTEHLHFTLWVKLVQTKTQDWLKQTSQLA